MSKYNLKKLCITCNKLLLDTNKTGYCNKHRDRSGKNNSFYGKKHDKKMIEKTKKKLSKISTKLWLNDNYRKKVIKGTSKPRKETFGKEQSIRVKKWYQDNPTQRDIRSKQMKKSWTDGKIEPNINSINESKLERELREELIRLLPNRNVRKTTIRINKKWFYPDIRIDKNIIIEFYGNYWHANPRIYQANDIIHHKNTAKQSWEHDKKRIKILEDSGFKVFIVWEDEYQNNKKQTIENIISNLKI